MPSEKRIVFLTPGQQAPIGSTGVPLSNGGLVWIGEQGTFPKEIKSHKMTEEEEITYEKLKKFHLLETDFQIDFVDYCDETKLAARKAELKMAIDNIKAAQVMLFLV